MYRYQRRLRRIALIALLGLLFQHAAMAAHLCSIEGPSQGLDLQIAAEAQTPCHAVEAIEKAVCDQHCNPVAASVDHAPALSVPLILLCECWALLHARRQIIGHAMPVWKHVDPCATAPPLSVLHCTYQI